MMMTQVIIKYSNGVLEVVVIIVMMTTMTATMVKTDGERESDLHVCSGAGCCIPLHAAGRQICTL